MKYAYIGEVCVAVANKICDRHSQIVITGIDSKGNAELGIATESKRLIEMYQSALRRGTI